ncbi:MULTISPECIES: hypothetical protein [unclassified Streptomyces]|uniref:hypothetical protein n=1 Tax=unclassified Streptomyces TaxID=2593676 RepID=UPI00081E037E|nr:MULTISPECIES: hypothetical protein [unclassified Streptomyces]MYZ36497.1 hypothetical protein [Streptomyces sp. SID4917]SCF84064.1 hypothetical protein GA0115259_103462 [Streptomyces sp. MnatMP-M17]
MSFGDEHGYGGDSGRTDDSFGGTGQTRTRLPDGRSGDMYGGGARRPARGSRSLITVVGVVVLLIAAIAFANRGGDKSAEGGKGTGGTAADPTAASGVKPVTGKNGTIPSGFAQNEQGAASAAANYAVALGSDGMFSQGSRHSILDTVYTPDAAGRLKESLDAAYTTEFLEKLGLDANGSPPQGSTFVSRTIPVGTSVESLSGDSAKVSVWYTGLIGMSGPDSTDPVSTTWKTWTFDLRWMENDWRIAAESQKDGPAPVPGDVAASTADEISKAVEQYGGFTYAR